MKKCYPLAHHVLLCLFFFCSTCLANNDRTIPFYPEFQEVRGNLLLETRLFPESAAFSGQSRNDASIVLAPEYYAEWPGVTSLTVSPFLRVDTSDARRTHFDMRELFLRTGHSDWSVGVGFGKVFWGTTESKHLVDIINQTDLIESPTGEHKFGQPMLNLSFSQDWGFLDVYIMPYFRERIFQSRSGRLRAGVLVDGGQTQFDSDLGKYHPDISVRYNNSVGPWDIGLAQFYGTSRDPTLNNSGQSKDGDLVLLPDYELIHQTAIDIQYTVGSWLWKLESLFRRGQKNALGNEEQFFSSVGGFEYNFFGALTSKADVGVLLEYMRDSRLNRSTDPLEHDIFSGLRLTLNDEADTQALAGVVQDISDSTRQVIIEASRRLTDTVRLNVNIQYFASVEDGDVSSDLKGDDFIRFELAYYY